MKSKMTDYELITSFMNGNERRTGQVIPAGSPTNVKSI